MEPDANRGANTAVRLPMSYGSTNVIGTCCPLDAVSEAMAFEFVSLRVKASAGMPVVVNVNDIKSGLNPTNQGALASKFIDPGGAESHSEPSQIPFAGVQYLSSVTSPKLQL